MTATATSERTAERGVLFERSSATVSMLVLLCALTARCSFDTQPTLTESSTHKASPTTAWAPPAARSSQMQPLDASSSMGTVTRSSDASLPNTKTGVVPTGIPDAATSAADTGVSTPAADAGQKPMSMVAGQMAPAAPTAAGAASEPTVARTGCSRSELQASADAYLQAMARGATQGLDLDPNLRYTENGEVARLGSGGLWLSRPRSEYARHFLDDKQCSTLSVVVLDQGGARLIFSARLLYLDARLLEAETIFVGPNGPYFRPEGIVSSGTDAWTAPVEMSVSMSREELMSFAERYFNSTVDPSRLPPHAPECVCLQNGAPAGLGCGDTPGTQRFQQLRYPVIDEAVGVVTAIAWSNGVIAMYFFKAQAGEMQNIEAIGGNRTAKTGW